MRWAALPVLVVVLATAPTGSSATLRHFEGDLDLSEAIKSEGTVSTNGSLPFRLDQQFALLHAQPLPLPFNATEATGKIYEFRARGGPGSPAQWKSLFGLVPGQQRPEQEYRLLHPNVTLEGLASPAEVTAMPIENDQGSVHLEAGSCGISRTHLVNRDFHGVRTERTEGHASQRRLHWLRAECEIAGARLTGAWALLFFNVTINVDYMQFNETSHAYERQTLRVETGTSVEADPTVPGFFEITTRVFRLATTTSGDSLSIVAPSSVELQAPGIGAVGRLVIPPSNGTISWDTTVLQDPPEPLEPQGAFLLFSSGATLLIRGQTSNAPVGGGLASPSPVIVGALLMAALLVATLVSYFRAALLTLYSKLTRAGLLLHPLRRRIFGFVASNPGAQLQEVCIGLAEARGVVRHHIRVLSEHGLVATRRFGNRRVLFVAGKVSWASMQQVHRARDPRLRVLLRMVRNEPNTTQQELGRRLGVSQSRVSKMVRELRLLGLLSQDAIGQPLASGARK